MSKFNSDKIMDILKGKKQKGGNILFSNWINSSDDESESEMVINSNKGGDDKSSKEKKDEELFKKLAKSLNLQGGSKLKIKGKYRYIKKGQKGGLYYKNGNKKKYI